MVDLFGVPVEIGDKVCYTTGSQGNEFIEIGTILSIETKRDWKDNIVEYAILKSSSGRKMSNARGKYGIVAIKPIQSQHPELFI